jgi:hypothetical protein
LRSNARIASAGERKNETDADIARADILERLLLDLVVGVGSGRAIWSAPAAKWSKVARFRTLLAFRPVRANLRECDAPVKMP